MALETLKGVEEIGGFEVDRDFSYPTKDYPINIDDTKNIISFKIQKGPIGEVGKTGCQVVTMIQTAKMIIEKLNEKFLCAENIGTIAALEVAIDWQEKRTRNREARSVEGTSQV